jgi:hypothetical protein
MTDAFRGLYRTIDGAYVTNGMNRPELAAICAGATA